MQPTELTINNVNGGALVDLFNMARDEVLANIADPNTSYKAKRQIVLTVTLTPSGEERRIVNSKCEVATKLAKVDPTQESTVFVHLDNNGGLKALTMEAEQNEFEFIPDESDLEENVHAFKEA